MGLWSALTGTQERLFDRRAFRAGSEKRRLIAEAELYEKMAEVSSQDNTAQGEGTSEWAREKARELRLQAELK